MSSARESVLAKIREALRDVPREERPENVTIDRSYRAVDPSPREALIEQFVDRVSESKATVRKVASVDLPLAIIEACAVRGVKRLVVPADLPDGWVPAGIGILREPGLTNDQLERSDGVLTACALGIAQTGTIVLDSGPGQGRRAITLLPDYHLCVIRDDQVVGLMPEAVKALQSVAADPSRPLTFISGPSATSDIELNRVEGVHGPRTLEILVVTADR
jgi:L-lactate dehydrogenase complex protein LldG